MLATGMRSIAGTSTSNRRRYGMGSPGAMGVESTSAPPNGSNCMYDGCSHGQKNWCVECTASALRDSEGAVVSQNAAEKVGNTRLGQAFL